MAPCPECQSPKVTPNYDGHSMSECQACGWQFLPPRCTQCVAPAIEDGLCEDHLERSVRTTYRAAPGAPLQPCRNCGLPSATRWCSWRCFAEEDGHLGGD